MLFTSFHTRRRDVFLCDLILEQNRHHVFFYKTVFFVEEPEPRWTVELNSGPSVLDSFTVMWCDVQHHLQVGPAHDSVIALRVLVWTPFIPCVGRWSWIRHAGPLTLFHSVDELSVTRFKSSMSQRVGTFCRISDVTGCVLVQLLSSVGSLCLNVTWIPSDTENTERLCGAAGPSVRPAVLILFWFWFCSGSDSVLVLILFWCLWRCKCFRREKKLKTLQSVSSGSSLKPESDKLKLKFIDRLLMNVEGCWFCVHSEKSTFFDTLILMIYLQVVTDYF